MIELSRQRRKTLTDKMVAALPRRRKRYIQSDPELRGHYVRVPAQGPCVFAAVARYQGKQVWATLGSADVLTIDAAREQARAAIKRIKQGQPAFEPPPVQPDTVADVCAGWLKRHVEAKGLRTGYEMRRVIERYVLPRWRDRRLRRDQTQRRCRPARRGRGQAAARGWVTACWRRCAACRRGTPRRHDDYVPPFVKNMRRVPASARSRSRILDDDELEASGKQPKPATTFIGAFVRVALLCGQRRAKARRPCAGRPRRHVWRISTSHARREPRRRCGCRQRP